MPSVPPSNTTAFNEPKSQRVFGHTIPVTQRENKAAFMSMSELRSYIQAHLTGSSVNTKPFELPWYTSGEFIPMAATFDVPSIEKSIVFLSRDPDSVEQFHAPESLRAVSENDEAVRTSQMHFELAISGLHQSEQQSGNIDEEYFEACSTKPAWGQALERSRKLWRITAIAFEEQMPDRKADEDLCIIPLTFLREHEEHFTLTTGNTGLPLGRCRAELRDVNTKHAILLGMDLVAKPSVEVRENLLVRYFKKPAAEPECLSTRQEASCSKRA